MSAIVRLPAVPLIASDPYLSIWMPDDAFAATDTAHWSGAKKPLRCTLTVDGKAYRCLGAGDGEAGVLLSSTVTPTKTRWVTQAGAVQLEIGFITPALPDDLDQLSMPVTLLTFRLWATDGQAHAVSLCMKASDALCYDGDERPALFSDTLSYPALQLALCGQVVQKPLCHSGDHITMDWGYLYLASDLPVAPVSDGLALVWDGTVNAETSLRALIAYDDIVSINYFGDLCKAWYRRDGRQITDAIFHTWARFDELLLRCDALDDRILKEAHTISEDYALIVSAAWRQVFAAHKLIATPSGELVMLSKENDSNGCTGTADVSYPSIPLFLKYCPELVNALCKPVLAFASMPVWTDDFAPHDVGRYPYATGQAYAAKRPLENGAVYPPYYLYPAGADIYDPRGQMPVEECGNMLIMLAAAQHYGADRALAMQYHELLEKWVSYLLRYGEDPGEQLCTDDFAGHLAHNVNLAAKAIVGVACYGRLINDAALQQRAQDMATRLLAKLGCEGNTPLTLDGKGWSMKYNFLWDRVLGLQLFPDAFYQQEIASYLPRINRYGLPLDDRADYTKSDWICWIAAMSDDAKTRASLIAPIATMLRESPSRVPFTDWYDTKTGKIEYFIARSVQGGLFAPLLRP